MATVSNIATTARRSHVTSGLKHKTIARAGIAIGALTAAAIFVPASLADWASADHPAFAARIAPWDAPAAAAAAAALRGDPRTPQSRALVSKALARDATLVPAIELRAVDLALSGHTTDARRLFALSDKLSRRSLPTRLWLIQDSVDRGDVAGALRNFDIALRTTTDAQPILFPVLAKASADPTLTMPLARTLDRPSDWRLMFIEWALANSAHLDGIAGVIAQMRDRRFVVANGIDQRLMEQLADARQFAAASLLNRRYGRTAIGVADPHFTDRSARYPFGWALVDDGALSAERGLVGSSGVLKYGAAPAHSGQVAAQLLTVEPGQYWLATTTAADAVGEAPFWSLTCGGKDGPQLARLDQPARAGGRASTAFSVPEGCTAQWLTLTIRPFTNATPQSGAIASVSVTASR